MLVRRGVEDHLRMESVEHLLETSAVTNIAQHPDRLIPGCTPTGHRVVKVRLVPRLGGDLRYAASHRPCADDGDRPDRHRATPCRSRAGSAILSTTVSHSSPRL